MAKKNIGDSWKKKDYEKYILNLISRTASPEAQRRISLARNFEYFYGKHENERYSNLLSLNESSLYEGSTPFVPLNFDAISPKLNLLAGELRQRGFEPRIRAKNVEAYKRKKAFENQLRFQMQMQPTYKRAAEFTGIDYGVNNSMPDNEEALRDYMKSYRDDYERVIEGDIKGWVDQSMYMFSRKNLFMDLQITNEVHLELDDSGDYPTMKRVNPLHCIHDLLAQDDFRRDSNHFIKAYYISIPEAIRRFGLQEAKMKELLDEYRKGTLSGWSGFNYPIGNGTYYNVLSPFENRGGGWGGFSYTHTLIYCAYWVDIESVIQKTTYDKYDQPHVHNYIGYDNRAKLTATEEEDKRNSIEQTEVEAVRYATMVAGNVLTEWGKGWDYLRSYRNPKKAVLPVTSLVANYNNYDSVSLVERVGSLQDFRNYVLTKMQLAITTAMDGVVVVDIAKLPDFFGNKDKTALEDFLHTLKTYKIAVIDSSKDELSLNPNIGTPVEAMDVKSRTVILESIQIAAFLQDQIDDISGINKARMGHVAPRQLSSTTQLGLTQSSAITESIFESFLGFEKIAFSKFGACIAYKLDNDEALRNEVSARYNIVDLPDDFSFQDYEPVIMVNPMTRQHLTSLIELSLAQGGLSFPDAMRLLMQSQHDLRGAIEEFIRFSEKREREMMAIQAQQAQQAQQAAMAARQMDVQGKMGVEDRRGQWGVEKSRVISDADERANMRKVEQSDREAQLDRASVQDQITAMMSKRSQQGNE